MQTFFLSLILLRLTIPLQCRTLPFHQSHFTKRSFHQNDRNVSPPQEYFEVTKPLPFDGVHATCTLPILTHNFSNTYGLPPLSVPYFPPLNCIWTHVTLEIQASCQGEQYDRIAALWLGGAELIRTSTAEPTADGIFWTVRKDVTRYSSLLSQNNLTLSVMLENIVNDVFTGVYQVNVTFLYYDANAINVKPLLALPSENYWPSSRKLKSAYNPLEPLVDSEKGSFDLLYEKPADLIIPISEVGDEGYWFRIQNESDIHSRGVRIPQNTYRAVVEIYVSFHGNDEFWYSNPPDSYLKVANDDEAQHVNPSDSYANMNKVSIGRGHGAYREVLVMIDGNLVGSVVPFPVIFTGGINPLFWEPVVSIGAFDLPSYDVELTPYLGLLLDGKVHSFSVQVADGVSFWLVDANLHLWLDAGSEEVQAGIAFSSPEFSLERELKFDGLDGKFQIEAERETKIYGWVSSTAGNFTTSVSQKLKFKNSIKFKNNGTRKLVKQKVMEKIKVRIESGTGYRILHTKTKRTYPLKITTETLPGGNNTYSMIARVTNSVKEKKTVGRAKSTLENSQKSSGWMSVKDHEVLSGGASTEQNYSYEDGLECYSRVVEAENGTLLKDAAKLLCATSS
ncbi:unnamed protein product [Coffea canephora]|uniref:Peptide N-acetyl-beta-D-glucosaminyl asparaginase amidase A N-terminal domain-containing protein n=1 Tax=Coffea canephora TaxID=49390 RepID=A0A068V1K2_COFCA|nr:unnamed protein product [Coffea canephora]